MKKGCLLSLLLLGLLVGGYYLVFSQFFYPPGDRYGALVAGLFAWLAVGLLQNAFRARADAAVIRAALVGDHPRDGKMFAAIGRITPVRNPLNAPISGKVCCAYAYDIGEPDSFDRESSTPKAFTGFALTPSTITTSSAEIRLLGLPILDELPQEFHDRSSRAQEFVRDTRFESLSAMQILKAVSSLTSALSETDGAVEKNWRITSDNDLTGLRLCEQRLDVGQEVCILGLYSQQHGGLVPNLGKSQINRLVLVPPPEAAKQFQGSFRAGSIGGLLLFGLATAAAFGILTLRENSEDVVQAKSEALAFAVQEQQLDQVQRLIARGTPLNRTNYERRTPLMLATTRDIAEALIAAGADVNGEAENGYTPLMDAAEQNNLMLAEVLLSHGARLDAVSSRYGATSLKIAEAREHHEMATLLRNAEAAKN